MTTASPSPSLPLALLESLMQLAPLDVLLFDTDLICRYAAPAGETLFGRTPADLVGEPASVLFSPEQGDLHTALGEAAADAGSFDYPSYRYAVGDAETQQYYCWSVRIQPLHLLDYRGRDEFRGVLVTLADVQDLADERDRLQAEQERLLGEHARRHAELEDLRARLTSSTAAHQEVRAQVRDLLTPAYGFLQLIAQRPETLNGQSPERLINEVVLPRLRAVVATLDAAAQAATDQSAGV
jgi:hypothetical protein